MGEDAGEERVMFLTYYGAAGLLSQGPDGWVPGGKAVGCRGKRVPVGWGDRGDSL